MLLVTNSRIYSINCKNWLCPWELITAFDALGIIYLRGTIYRQTLILFYVRASWFIGPSLPLQVVSPWAEFNNHYVLRVWKFVLFICLCECVYSSIFQPCDEIISTFCCKGITLGFFYHFVNVLSIKCHTKKWMIYFICLPKAVHVLLRCWECNWSKKKWLWK